MLKQWLKESQLKEYSEEELKRLLDQVNVNFIRPNQICEM